VHTMLGLNCRGSGYCNISCGRNIWQLKAHVDTICTHCSAHSSLLY
jgi:hypothetical protein